MKKFSYSDQYRGQQITKLVCAKNAKEASEKLGINIYTVRKYCLSSKTEDTFEGVMAYFDSGMLWRERKDLIQVIMPLEELKTIIDTCKTQHEKEK